MATPRSSPLRTGTIASAQDRYFPINNANFSLISAGTLALSVKMADFKADPHLQGLRSSKTRTAARISFWPFSLFWFKTAIT